MSQFQLRKRGKNFQKESSSQPRSTPKTCYNCGGEYPHSFRCPAEGRECNNCHKLGHFARVCRGGKTGQPTGHAV